MASACSILRQLGLPCGNQSCDPQPRPLWLASVGVVSFVGRLRKPQDPIEQPLRTVPPLSLSATTCFNPYCNVRPAQSARLGATEFCQRPSTCLRRTTAVAAALLRPERTRSS